MEEASIAKNQWRKQKEADSTQFPDSGGPWSKRRRGNVGGIAGPGG